MPFRRQLQLHRRTALAQQTTAVVRAVLLLGAPPRHPTDCVLPPQPQRPRLELPSIRVDLRLSLFCSLLQRLDRGRYEGFRPRSDSGSLSDQRQCVGFLQRPDRDVQHCCYSCAGLQLHAYVCWGPPPVVAPGWR